MTVPHGHFYPRAQAAFDPLMLPSDSFTPQTFSADVNCLFTKSCRERVLYPRASSSLTDDELRSRLSSDLNVRSDGGSSSDCEYLSDDEPSSASGNRWRIHNHRFQFACKPCHHPVTGELNDGEVRRTSDIPISDKVLTRNGNESLTCNAVKVLKELSALLLDSADPTVTNGLFNCVSSVAGGDERVYLDGGRPFPYFYSREHPPITGYVFHTERIHGNGREVKFVKTGEQSVLPESLREKLIYLLPNTDSYTEEEDSFR